MVAKSLSKLSFNLACLALSQGRGFESEGFHFYFQKSIVKVEVCGQERFSAPSEF